jgi:hypothetical protein
LKLEPGQSYDYPTSKLDSTYISKKKAASYIDYIYGEKDGGGTQYMMLAGVPFDKLGMPKLPETSVASVSEGIQHTLYKGMIAPVAVLGGLMYAAYKSTRKGE